MKFGDEVKRFRDWAHGLEDRLLYWEMNYPDWHRLQTAFFTFLDETDKADWDEQDWQDVLYAVARDNENKYFIGRVSEDPSLLKRFSLEVLKSDEADAKWQIAECLGRVAELEFAEPILLILVDDADEYVRRRSLLALSVLGSKEAERLAILAWETGLLYQRIGALHALSNIGSPRLHHFLELAKQDGRTYLVANASELYAERAELD